jgi:hypothetical protein
LAQRLPERVLVQTQTHKPGHLPGGINRTKVFHVKQIDWVEKFFNVQDNRAVLTRVG